MTPKSALLTIAATIRPTMAHPIVHRRLMTVPCKNPTLQAYSSLPVPTAAIMWGWAKMPTRPLTVSMAINHHPICLGVAIEKAKAGSVCLIPLNPPTRLHPSGISRVESTMIRNP